MPFVFAQACVPAVPVWGEKDQYFPIHRVYAIAGNYADHLAELGREEKTEPVFFTKPSDGLVVCREGKSADIPYARETDSLCLEVELVVAIDRQNRAGNGLCDSRGSRGICFRLCRRC